ncbi:hypothetical protein [Natranaerobius thermophilus]|uniref:hypothetical protein n=1 Tax=Natranaerobius thermophilus TaxID=375929 RepID=UPI002F41C8E0
MVYQYICYNNGCTFGSANAVGPWLEILVQTFMFYLVKCQTTALIAGVIITVFSIWTASEICLEEGEKSEFSRCA